MKNTSVIKLAKYGAFSLAVSSDYKCLAVGAGSKVQILSLPEATVLHTLPICNASSMVFLDNCESLLVVTTTGGIFLWKSEKLHRLGQWPASLWRESPIFGCGQNYVALAHDEGVCLFDLQSRQFKDVYLCPGRSAEIAAYKNGKLHMITYAFTKDWQKIQRVAIDLQGNTYDIVEADCKLDVSNISRPVLLENNTIAFFAVFRRHIFTPDKSICTIDCNGHVVKSQSVPANYPITGCAAISVSKRYIAYAHMVSPHGVTMYAQDDLSLMGQITSGELWQEKNISPPSSLLFLSDAQLLIGTWDALFLYQIKQ